MSCVLCRICAGCQNTHTGLITRFCTNIALKRVSASARAFLSNRDGHRNPLAELPAPATTHQRDSLSKPYSRVVAHPPMNSSTRSSHTTNGRKRHFPEPRGASRRRHCDAVIPPAPAASTNRRTQQLARAVRRPERERRLNVIILIP
jgi:hypothetical protein